jgi:hypothetical protein
LSKAEADRLGALDKFYLADLIEARLFYPGNSNEKPFAFVPEAFETQVDQRGIQTDRPIQYRRKGHQVGAERDQRQSRSVDWRERDEATRLLQCSLCARSGRGRAGR